MCPSMKPGRIVLPPRSWIVVLGLLRAEEMSGSDGEPTAVMVEPVMRRHEAKVGGAVEEGLVPGWTPEMNMLAFVKRVDILTSGGEASGQSLVVCEMAV